MKLIKKYILTFLFSFLHIFLILSMNEEARREAFLYSLAANLNDTLSCINELHELASFRKNAHISIIKNEKNEKIVIQEAPSLTFFTVWLKKRVCIFTFRKGPKETDTSYYIMNQNGNSKGKTKKEGFNVYISGDKSVYCLKTKLFLGFALATGISVIAHYFGLFNCLKPSFVTLFPYSS